MSNLYLENDEDITSAIDKLTKAEGAEVRVVVPKRSNLLASLINLKLLKKAAHENKKKLILVTGDTAIVNLASRVDLPVAENVTAEAEVPDAAKPKADESEVIEEEAAPKSANPVEIPIEASPLEIRKTPEDEPTKPEKPSKKGPRIPSFGSLQKRIFIGAGVIAVIIGLFVLNFLFQKANVTIFASGNQIPTELSFKTDSNSGDPASGIIGSTALTQQKDVSDNFNATGKKDAGTKATGTITVQNCYTPGPKKLPAGTQFVSAGKVFTSDADVTVPGGSGNFFGCNSPGTKNVDVTATKNGDDYNLASGSVFSVSGYPSSGSAYMRGVAANQFSGGTSKTITVVSATDLASAKAKLAKADSSLKTQLAGTASSDQMAALNTFSGTLSDVVASPNVGDEATTFTVSATANFKMLAFNKTDLDNFIKDNAGSKIGNGNQIYDTGLSGATISPAGGKTYNLKTTVYAGTKLDEASIKKQIKGKKLGDASTVIQQIPGVDKVSISTTPFWVTSIPSLTSRINIIFKVSPAGQ